MTDDEILQMGLRSGCVEEVKLGIDVYRFDIVGLRNFIALVAASEREACANICDDLADEHEKRDQWNSHKTADVLAQAIRARS